MAVFPVVTCGTCATCTEGREEACTSLALIGTHRPGAYAQFCVAPARNVHRVPDGITSAVAASLALNGPVAANQLAQAGLRPGEDADVTPRPTPIGPVSPPPRGR